MPSHTIRLSLLLISLWTSMVQISAQDIEPRRWGDLPVGTQVIGAGYGYSFGKVLFDPLLEAENVEVDVHSFVATYVHTLRLGKKFSRFDILIPVSFAKWEGLLSGDPTTVERNGMADPRLRFSIHLTGPGGLNAEELAAYLKEHQKYTTIGLSLAVSIPIGQYNEERLLNLGLNQFVFRPQLGLVHNWGLWSFELTASAFIFTDNTNFFNDSEKRQDPLFAGQAHLIKRFNPRQWISISAGYGLGGQSVVNRQSNNDTRSNFLGAVSYGFPLGKRQNLKLVYLRTETLKELGANTDSFILAWLIAF